MEAKETTEKLDFYYKEQEPVSHIKEVKQGMTEKRLVYKPFEYPEAYDYWLIQQQSHWLHTEATSIAEDVTDYNEKLTESERNVIDNVLKLFTQVEINVEEYWTHNIMQWFPKPEIQMMAASFGAFESIHIAAYSYLNDSLGVDDYSAFLLEPSMKNKIDRLIGIENNNLSFSFYSKEEKIAKSLAIFSAFTEGVSLFSSFAILISFSRFGKLKSIKDIISWSIRDEDLHSRAGCWLFREFIKENPHIWTDEFKKDLYEAARITVAQEDEYIDKIFELGPIEGLDPDDLKEYIRYRANTKLGDIGLKKNWKNIDYEKIERMNWFDFIISAQAQGDFFARRVTEYAKGNLNFENVNYDLLIK